MSNQPKPNPFDQAENLAPIFESSDRYQSNKTHSLNQFRSQLTSTNQTQSQTTPKPNLNFNLSHFMSYNFTHFTRFSIAGLSLFTVLAGGVATQALAPEEFKPSNLLLENNTTVSELKTTTCNQNIEFKLNDDLVFTKTDEDKRLDISIITKKQKQDNDNNINNVNNNKNMQIVCYPSDGSVSWDDIYKFNLKPTNKGVRYWFSNLYCRFLIGKGDIQTAQGCVNNPAISKVDVKDLPFFTQKFKDKINIDQIYLKNSDTKTLGSEYGEDLQYYIGTRDGKYICLLLNDEKYFNDKIQIGIK